MTGENTTEIKSKLCIFENNKVMNLTTDTTTNLFYVIIGDFSLLL
jgi:hypothetical protein